MKKKYVSFICLIILCLLFIGCKKDEVPVDENGNYVAPILEGEHTIFEKDFGKRSSYLDIIINKY